MIMYVPQHYDYVFGHSTEISREVYMHVSNFLCGQKAIFMRQNSILIFNKNTFYENNSLNLLLIAISFESIW